MNDMTDKREKELAQGLGSIVKGYAKRLAGEIAPRPDLVVEGEKEQTEGLRHIREAKQKAQERKAD